MKAKIIVAVNDGNLSLKAQTPPITEGFSFAYPVRQRARFVRLLGRAPARRFVRVKGLGFNPS